MECIRSLAKGLAAFDGTICGARSPLFIELRLCIPDVRLPMTMLEC